MEQGWNTRKGRESLVGLVIQCDFGMSKNYVIIGKFSEVGNRKFLANVGALEKAKKIVVLMGC